MPSRNRRNFLKRFAYKTEEGGWGWVKLVLRFTSVVKNKLDSLLSFN